MDNTIWVLTEEFNGYDQHGEYFVSVFREKPSKKLLLAAGVDESEVEHVLQGGGRKSDEYHWYFLKTYWFA